MEHPWELGTREQVIKDTMGWLPWDGHHGIVTMGWSPWDGHHEMVTMGWSPWDGYHGMVIMGWSACKWEVLMHD